MTVISTYGHTGPTATKKMRSGISISVVGMTLGLALSSCGFFEDSRAVTYEIHTVSGEAGSENLRVEYQWRETGLSEQETVATTVTESSEPAQFETLGRVDDDVSVSVAGVPGVVLGCAVIIDDSETLVEAESSAPGEAVECSATVPAQDDQG
ncbi:hypothetical protein [Nesterenkonia sandarakina]|uniref:MmpS family membrane protein n=1 Tax=Nesterenkonia sandarakina TaxID=272918 RepID=A0A7Z0EBV7_9MICC|nr:hypothetical protein [Nesterenkonia sandarakina]NYJ18149.1 hypothetical protein [Nesterenkonia sandarakina]